MGPDAIVAGSHENRKVKTSAIETDNYRHEGIGRIPEL